MKKLNIIWLKDKMVVACLLSNLFYSLAYPTINKILITNITDNYIATNAMVICACTIVLGRSWNKNSNKLINFLPLLMLSETLIYLILISGMINHLFDFKFYYIADTAIFAIVSKNVMFGVNKLKSLRYNQEERNQYDNNIQIASNASSLLGFALNIILDMNMQIAFSIIFIGLTVDNVFYYFAYKETVKDDKV